MTSITDSPLFHDATLTAKKDNKLRTHPVIWLDNSINSQNNTSIEQKSELDNEYFKKFDKIDECINHIRSIPSRNGIILIVNECFGEELIPKIHNLSQVLSIHICCEKEQCDHQWYIRRFHKNLDDVLNTMQNVFSRRSGKARRDEILSISIFNSNKTTEKSTTSLDGHFVQSQLLIACLLKMKTISKDRSEFISYCRDAYKDLKGQQDLINTFDEFYEPEHALLWYSQESFLYRLLNKALRTQDIDLLYLFGFFIRDIEEQLKQEQHFLPMHLYRGQLMSLEEIKLLKDSENELISMNSFLSTSINPNVALFYLGSSDSQCELEKVLFEIDADPRLDGMKPFADISYMSQFSNEEEILMMLGSVFRVNDVRIDNNKIWHIKMSLCSENNSDLQKIFYHMTNQYNLKNTRLILFANVLIDMANFDDAEKYLHRLLQQMTSQHKEIYKNYHALGKVLFEKGYYEKSLKYYRKSLEHLSICEINDSRAAYIYNGIGEVYQTQGNITLALESFQTALNIFKEIFNDDNENLAWCYNNLGIAYTLQGNYSEASDYLTKALNIKKKYLPEGHPCLGNTYNNLGNVYYYLHQYDKALDNYQLTCEIFKKSLTSRHPSIARTLRNLGIANEAKKQFMKAKTHYEEALRIRNRILSSLHPDLIEIKKDIERVSSKISTELHYLVVLQ
ncbi:unnamed protein product [Rotaria sp. Silwood1]|nr:unnamed protein product [Rotaria sp. Silwood1]